MDGVILNASNKRLKQLMKEHGHQWIMLSEIKPMACFDNEKGCHIQSLDGKHIRNVRLTDISTFIEIEE